MKDFFMGAGASLVGVVVANHIWDEAVLTPQRLLLTAAFYGVIWLFLTILKYAGER